MISAIKQSVPTRATSPIRAPRMPSTTTTGPTIRQIRPLFSFATATCLFFLETNAKTDRPPNHLSNLLARPLACRRRHAAGQWHDHRHGTLAHAFTCALIERIQVGGVDGDDAEIGVPHQSQKKFLRFRRGRGSIAIYAS